jgi:hypothetical protein
MDLDRLDLKEIRTMSKLIDTLGTPVAIDLLESNIRICEAASTMYRAQLAKSQAQSRAHGED